MEITIISCLISGISLGCLLFVFSCVLSLVLGLMGIVNLAHGSFYLLGGFVGLTIVRLTGNFLLGVLVGGAAVGLIALVLERFFIRFLYGKINEQVLLTFGFIYVFDDAVRTIWGPAVQFIATPALLAGTISIFGVSVPMYRLALIATGLLLFFGLWFFQEKTRYGSIIRAAVEDEEMVRGLGVNVPLVFVLVFSLGSVLAGAAGVIGAPVLLLYTGLDLEVLVYALIVVVIGGMGSLTGSLVASVLLGLVINFGGAFLPPGLSVAMIFAIMVITLVVRPGGLLGRT